MIHWIATPDDARLDPYRRVGDPVWLRERELFVAEGRLVVERLLDMHLYRVESILVNQAAYDAMRERLAAFDTNVFVGDDALLVAVTGFNFHRGCLALVRRPAPLTPERLMHASMLLGLEGVGNPDNVGGLFRTAAAFGVDGVLLTRSGDPYYRKAVRTSMAATLRVPFASIESWPEAIERFHAAGFFTIALTPASDALPLSHLASTLPPDARPLVLVGAEGAGLAPSTIARARAAVRIPIAPDVDSLNVVVAAGIALERIRSSAARQRERGGRPRGDGP